MTRKEEEIYNIIKNNPTIEQEEIAKMLSITRSTVAVHISSLQKQGLIQGRAYVLNSDRYILGIGASNVDIYGKSKIAIKQHYDHPANITSTIGGVMHNIIANYALLANNAKIITAVGDDSFGKMIIDDYKHRNIDTSHILITKNNPTGVFMQVQSKKNDMYMALCDQSALFDMNEEFLRKKSQIMTNAQIVVIDPSMPLESIEEIIAICKNKVKIYADPLSDNFAWVLQNYISDMYCIKPNKSELAVLSQMKINNLDDVKNACKSLLAKGLKEIYVSLGEDGLLFMDETTCLHRKLRKETKMVNASGAGDALMATMLYGEMNNLKREHIMDLALAAGTATIRCEQTICEGLSIDYLKRIIKENRE